MTDPITTPAPEAAIYYIDCEFDGHSGPLLSLAMVRADGYSTHIRVNIDANDPWVQANVMPIMDNHGADIAVTVDPDSVGQAIRDFIGPSEHPLIVADSPVDIGRFCAAISTASDGQWSSVDYPKIKFSVHNVTCYPTKLAGAVQHNAWWDAMALRDTLCRALPVAEPAPVVVRIKKLVWVDADEGMCTKWRAAALGGHYELVILDKEDGLFSVNFKWGNPLGFWFIQGEPDQFGPTGPKKFPSIEAAKDAAQADHDARVLSQIDAVPVAQVRAEALREGYDAGFAESGEGWNGEYPVDVTQRDAYRAQRTAAIRTSMRWLSKC